MDSRIQIVAIVAAGLLFVALLELVRQRRLLERYAILWLFSALGVAYPPNALFLVAFGFVLVLLLHFSLAVSRLSDQTKVLAQRLALLEEKIHQRGSATGERAVEEPEEELQAAARD
jgi:hypothetical protein